MTVTGRERHGIFWSMLVILSKIQLTVGYLANRRFPLVMTIKKTAAIIHLWLGLLTGLIVIASFLPAALFVWEAELTDLYYSKYIFTDQTAERPQSLSLLLQKAQENLPSDQKIETVEISPDADRAYAFGTSKNAVTPGWTSFSEYDYYKTVYINPYTGQLTGIVDQNTNWIRLLRVMHQQLLLNYEIGHLIVGITTLIMFVLVLTGLVLWWPKNKGALKQRFKIKFNARWRRVNYDFHNVGGFYTHLLILLFAVTGLVWTFDWWTDGIYRMLGNDPDKVFNKVPEPVPHGVAAAFPLDIVFADMVTKKPSWDVISFYLDGPKISGTVHYKGNSGWDTWDTHHYVSKTGQLYHSNVHENKTLGAKWRNSNYAIHVGNIYGITTKVLATFAALFCASLPVTGFLIWWGKRKKGKRKGRNSPAS